MRGVRGRKVSWPTLLVMSLVGLVAWWLTGASPLAVVVAVVAGWVILKLGLAVMSSLATPLPPPPPPGELRRVRLTFRCSICGTEVRMTSANDEVPEPPRHCQEDMEPSPPSTVDLPLRLVTPPFARRTQNTRSTHRLWTRLGRVTAM